MENSLIKNSLPRLCKMLGVMPYQDFNIEGFEDSFFIDDVGLIGSNEDRYIYNSYRILEALCDVLEKPEKVKPLSRWTKEDIENARKIKDLFPWAKSIWRISPENFEIRREEETDKECAIIINTQMFQSLLSGEEIMLEDIIGGNANDD